MPPNLGNTIRLNSLKKKNADPTWSSDDDFSNEKQRPPIYNPEDYALSLKKWGRKSASNGTSNGINLYGASAASSDAATIGQKATNGANSQTVPLNNVKESTLVRDYRNPMLTAGEEMSLRQFGSVSELLTKLRSDLKLAFPSFVQEFIGAQLDGVTLLLEMLRSVQLSQAATNNSGGGTTPRRVAPSTQRRASLDELACLQCLRCCCARHADAVRGLARSPAGLYTLAVCIMSNVNRSRVIALQLLTMVCEPNGNGHSAVSEALSTLRLRFGEPVRFRFLVGVLSSARGHAELLAAGLRFLNAFIASAESPQKRLYIQAELEQAGFDIDTFKKIVPINSSYAERVYLELDKWERNHVNVEKLTMKIEDFDRQNESLRDKLKLLERRVQILLEEKSILLSLEQCLKERCSELQDELSVLKSGKKKNKNLSSTRRTSSSSKRDDSTPAEDEGISSSERSLSPDADVQNESMIYEVFNIKNETISMNPKNQGGTSTDVDDEATTKKLTDDEEETTIEEVIEELENIINDAETEALEKERLEKIQKEKNDKNKIVIHTKSILDTSLSDELEDEIIPINIHPQPPRKVRSFVNVFFPNNENQYESRQQELFFEDEAPLYDSDEESDSLLSASKCPIPCVDRQEVIDNADDNRALLNTIMDARERAEQYERRRHKSKQSEIHRRSSMKRSESFHHLAPDISIVQIKDANIKSVKHSSIDGLYIVDVNSPIGTPKLKQRKNSDTQNGTHGRKKSMDDAAAEKLRSKSLDRIDEGLDSMVDIVMTSDCHRFDSKSRTNTSENSSRVKSIVVVSRTESKVYTQPYFSKQQYLSKKSQFSAVKDPKSSLGDEKHRVFLPNYSYEQESSDCSRRLLLPNRTDTFVGGNNAINLSRGNAGMYSGQQKGKKMICSIPSSDYRSMSPMGSKNNTISVGKFTDVASGLY